ncbi:MAG: hypothetical protein HQL22_05210 [Candidatus Omnitrophica bacterium]|nr:hypothetical protein [Candidatus Omnitrophota bacterium]
MVDRKEELLKFSKWIRAQLFNRSMTARDLSILSGVDESEVSKLTRGVRWPSLLTLKMIAPHLQWDAGEFLIAAGLEKGDLFIKTKPERAERRYTKDEVAAIVNKACQKALEVLD